MTHTLIVLAKRQPVPPGFVVVPVHRPFVLGNPFCVAEQGRVACIACFRVWLWQQLQHDTPQRREVVRLAALLDMHDVALICYCKPLACHGDIVAAAVHWWRRTQSALQP